MRISALAAVSLALAASASPAQDRVPSEEAPPVEVMVLGVYHFANPGLDVINIEVDDVLAPQRQQDLEAITDALARWRPTRIVLETSPETQDLHIASYRDNPEGLIAEHRSERYQIGYRLALKLSHEDVYGFDEQPGEGEPDYFPLGEVQAWAEANGRESQLGELFGWAESQLNTLAADDGACSIAANLMVHNDPAWQEEGHSRLYVGMLQFGDAQQQPGAELNAYWFMRNAKMFAKAGLIAEPGDRVLIIVGSGHKYWLDYLARMTPGYTSVDPRPYLAAADDGRCQ